MERTISIYNSTETKQRLYNRSCYVETFSKIDFKNNIVELKYENEYVKINLIEEAPKEIGIIYDPDYTNQLNCIQGIGENSMFDEDLPEYLSNMQTVNYIETEDLNALTREMIDEKINGI